MITDINTLRQHVLDLLTSEPNLTRKEIRDRMAELNLNPDTKQLGNAIDTLRAAGLITTGNTTYENGRAVLTYILARQPVEGLAQAEARYPLSILTDDTDSPHDGNDDIDVTVLDSSDKLESSLIALIKQYRAQKHSLPKLRDPARTREVLQLLSDSLLVNPDVKPELQELADVINHLETVS